ncbi:MAG: helix-turn-helix transcriptional regulator [Clostridia bacterium]|nr:helix-turn-helix transcriptional regulator [Clostridia bacterium]
MDSTFDLKSLRKAKNMKQEELAATVGVSPQAVSKWEQGGLPDAALLPAVADALGVTIDALFGRKKEELSFYDQFLRHMKEVPWEDTMRELYRIGQVCGASILRVKQYNEILFADVDEKACTEATLNEGFFQARLHEKQPYFLLIPEPKDGYESAAPYDEAFVRLYETLAYPNVLRAMYYIVSESYTYFDAEALAENLSVSQEEAERIIERLLSINFIDKARFAAGAQNKTIYQGKAYIEFISFLYFSHILMNRPTAFTYQTNSRTKPWFAGKTYRQKETLR